MESKSTLGSRLKRLRRERQASQVDAAVAAEISRSHLSKLENDEDAPGRAVLRRLAAFYGVTMDYLETGTEPARPEGPDQFLYTADDRAWAALGRELQSDQRDAVFDFIRKLAVAPTERDRNRKRSK